MVQYSNFDKVNFLSKVSKSSFALFATIFLLFITLAGCEKDDDDKKKVGVLEINENEYSITEVNMFVGTITNYSSFWGRHLFFRNKEDGMTVQITMTDNGLTSGTYTNINTYMFLGIAISNEAFDTDVENVIMVVKKSGNTYDIKITGKTNEKECEYLLTYKGTIRDGR